MDDFENERLIDKRTLLRLVPQVQAWLNELSRTEYRGVEEPGNPDRGVGR